jgi:hypothetical protein
METHTNNTSSEQRASTFATLNNLGEHIHKITALLRAAADTGPENREDGSWLVSLAGDEAEELQRRYMAWADAPGDGRAAGAVRS